jgi:fatty-acyl-CoA synthase
MALLTTEAITLGDALLRTAHAQPDDTAIAMPDGSWSWSELADRATRVARNLIGMGVEPGEHVGVMMANGFDVLATYFGVSLAGATMVPINARFRTRELGYIVNDADMVCVITSDANDAYLNYLDLLIESIEARGGAAKLRSLVVLGKREREGVVSGAAFDAYGEDVTQAQIDARRHGVSVADPAMILYTSGTTADPRGAIISHESIVRVWGGAVAHALRLGPEDRMWNPCPMFHIAALGVSVACTVSGTTIVTAPFFEPDSAVELIERERPTALFPAYANILLGVLTHPRYAELDLVATRALVVGPPTTLHSLQEQLPNCTLVSTFGMTESCGCSTFSDIDDPLDLRCETVGPVIAGLELRIADPVTDEPLPPDTRGEIQLRGPLLFDGYYNDPKKTAATFLPGGWMRTGDLGSLTPEGPAEGHHPRRRREPLAGRDRGAPDDAPRGADRAGGRDPGRAPGRGAGRVRRAARGDAGHRGGADRALRGGDRALQGAPPHPLRDRVADVRHQGPEVPPARADHGRAADPGRGVRLPVRRSIYRHRLV